MRALIVASLAALAAGCGGVDPCANHGGICVALRVEGSVKGLDRLDVTVDKPTTKTESTPTAAIALPVALALNLPAGTAGDVDVSVVGFGAGKPIASGHVSIDVSGNRGKGTVTLVGGAGPFDGGAGNDGGPIGGDAGSGSTDMAGCLPTAGCGDSDGCCPADCDGARDRDCPSVCGNGVTEPGEVCDDHNVVGGDGCDPTCQWHEQLDHVSGNPGSSGHADDPGSGYARLTSPAGVTGDPTSHTWYFSSRTDCTIRKAVGTGNNLQVTTLAGSAWDCSTAAVNGDLATARFDAPGDVELVGNALFVVEDVDNRVRKIDLSTGQVTTALTGQIQGIGRFGTKLAFMNYSGAPAGFYSYDPAAGSPVLITPISSFMTATVAAQPNSCFDAACDASTFCYLTCFGNVVRITMGNGAVANFAGLYNSSTGKFNSGCIDGANTSAAVFSGLNRIAFDGSSGNLYVTDQLCNDIRRIGTTTTTRIGGGVGSGFVDGPALMSAFNGPTGIVPIGSSDYYVADQNNGVIRWLTSSSTYTAVGYPHNYVDSTFSATAVATPNYGMGIAAMTSDANNAYVILADGSLVKVTLASGAATKVAAGSVWPTGTPHSMVLMGGTLYASAIGTIVSIATDGTGVATYAGTPNPTTAPSDGPKLSAVMYPGQLATDGTHLYFTDSLKLVRWIDDGGMVRTLAGSYTSMDDVDGTGPAGHFANAGALTTDGKTVWVADSVRGGQGGFLANTIRAVDIASQHVTLLSGDGSTNDHVDGAIAGARFSAITTLANDGHSLFVGDGEDYGHQKLHIGPTVRQVVLATGQVTTMIGTVGQQTFKPGVGAQARVHGPGILSFEPTTHALYLWDALEYVIARIK